MKKLKQLLVGAALVFGLVALPLTLQASAIDVIDSGTCNTPAGQQSAICSPENRNDTVDEFLKVLINTLLFIVGVIAVIVIIVAGIRYTTSGGNAQSVATAKNMLTYAIVGLVVSVLAYAIVNWVLQLFK